MEEEFAPGVAAAAAFEDFDAVEEVVDVAALADCLDAIPLADGSMDFGYSLGVLHHVPDTEAGIRACVSKLKPGAPFLAYIYYAFDNRPWWFYPLWRVSYGLRGVVSRMPSELRYWTCMVLAATVYWPATTDPSGLRNRAATTASVASGFAIST